MADRFVIVEPSSGGADLSQFPYIIKNIHSNATTYFFIDLLINPNYIDEIFNEKNFDVSTQTEVFKNLISQISLITKFSFPDENCYLAIGSNGIMSYAILGRNGYWYEIRDRSENNPFVIDQATGFYEGFISDDR